MNLTKENKALSPVLLVVLCTVTYFVSYITRINYGAVLLEMQNATGFSNEQLSLAVTGLSIFYGAGQLLSGYLGDRIRPRFLISAGLCTTALMNFLLPFCPNIPCITAAWCVNGLAQAMMWPPIVKVLSASLDSDGYKKACVKVCYGSALGTVSVYAFAPLLIHLAGWKSMFFVSAFSAAVMACVVFIKMPDVKKSTEIAAQKAAASAVSVRNAALPIGLLILIMPPIILQGALRDGVQTWMPTYVKNVFHLESGIAILTCVLMPIFGLICNEFAAFVNRKWIRNELLCACSFFGVAMVAAILLSFFHDGNVIAAVLLATVLTGCMHGVNVIFTCMIPPYFASSGKVSFVSGLLNSMTYVGSALSGYGFAALSTSFGWYFTVWSWAAICVTAVALCLIAAKPWGNFSKTEK